MNIKNIISGIFVGIVLLTFVPLPWAEGAYVPLTSFFLQEDSAHSSTQYGLQALGVRQDIATGTPATSENGDYGYLGVNKWNWLYTAPQVSTTSIALSGINNAFDTANEAATSTYFNLSNYKSCTFGFTLQSGGTGAHIIQLIPRKLQSDNSLLDYFDGYWGNAVFEDTVNAVSKGYELTFPCNRANYIYASTTSTSGSLTFTISNTYLYA